MTETQRAPFLGEEFYQEQVATSPSSAAVGYINAINILGSQSVNVIDPLFNFHSLKEEYGSPQKLANSLKNSVVSTAGYALVGATAGVIAFEQLPTNEEWRIRAGTETLIATGDPVEVAKTVFGITMLIELGSCAVVLAALKSKNPLVTSLRDNFTQWRESGLKRAEYRKDLKLNANEEKIKRKNIKREIKGKKLKQSKRQRIQNKMPSSENSKKVQQEATDTFVSLGIGAAITALFRGVGGLDKTSFQTAKTSIKYSTFLATFGAGLGYLIASGRDLKTKISVIDWTVDVKQLLIDYGTDSKALLTALGVAYTPSTIKKLVNRMPKREAGFQDWLSEQPAKDPIGTSEVTG